MTVRAACIAAGILGVAAAMASPTYAIDVFPDTQLLTKKSGSSECERMMTVQRQGRRAIEEFLAKAIATQGSLDISADITVRVSTRSEAQAISVRRFAEDFDLTYTHIDMHTILIETEMRHLVSLIQTFMAVKYNRANARMIDGVFELFVVQDIPETKVSVL